MAYEAGEFFPGARIQQVTATADISKGAVVTVTPAAAPTGAPCAEDGVGPFAVAIDTAKNGKTGRAVTKGEVSVDCSGNWIKPLGRMTVGGANGAVGVVDVGGF